MILDVRVVMRCWLMDFNLVVLWGCDDLQLFKSRLLLFLPFGLCCGGFWCTGAAEEEEGRE